MLQWVQYQLDIAQGCVIGAGCTGYHAIGISQLDHTGREDVPVIIDHALYITAQITLALHTIVEEFGVIRIAVGEARIDDLDRILRHADQAHIGAADFFATDEHGLAQLLVLEGIGGANDSRFLALGEDDAASVSHHGTLDALQEGGRWIEAAGQ